jgi:hypothetical protein
MGKPLFDLAVIVKISGGQIKRAAVRAQPAVQDTQPVTVTPTLCDSR